MNNLKFLLTRLTQVQLNMNQIDQQLKYLHYHQVNQKKFKYLTGAGLGYKPDVVEQAKFDYSLLSKVFNKISEKEDQKEKLL